MISKKDLILLGAGGHCKSCIDVIEKGESYLIHTILDVEESIGKRVLNFEIRGTDNLIPELAGKGEFLITVGQILNPQIRIKLYECLKKFNATLAVITSPQAVISKYSRLGAGTIVMHHAVVNADVLIGDNCIINTLSNIEHDVIIGNHCHISTGAMINGGVIIGNNCFVGSGAVISNNVSIADNVVVGAGAYVMKSIREAGVYVGNPAKFFKK